MVIGAGTTPGRTDLRSLAVRYADLRLRVPGRVPVVHVTGCQAVLGCERNQRLRPVVEVLVQDLVLGAVCPVEGEVEEAVGSHDPADVPEGSWRHTSAAGICREVIVTVLVDAPEK